jgi:hypothetical protein
MRFSMIQLSSHRVEDGVREIRMSRNGSRMGPAMELVDNRL